MLITMAWFCSLCSASTARDGVKQSAKGWKRGPASHSNLHCESDLLLINLVSKLGSS